MEERLRNKLRLQLQSTVIYRNVQKVTINGMNIKVTKLSDQQVESFRVICSAMGSLATLPMPGTYPIELKNCGVNERGTPCRHR